MAAFTNNERLTRIEICDENYHIDSSSKEIVVILLSGTIKVGQEVLFRKDVFAESAKGFYIANSGLFSIEAIGSAELCIIENQTSYFITALDAFSNSVVEATVPLTMIDSKNIKSKKAGSDNFFREVVTIIDNQTGLSNLIIGETFKSSGNWSSWPPHKHDTYEPAKETAQKEIYLYKFSEQNGFGIQLIYDNDVKESKVHIVKDNDEVKISKGHHPVVASPHSGMYYLWALFGDNKEFNVNFDEVYNT